ncbi:MAG: phosphotransferase, partial [Lachnospiraceae bacterium]|nr:phosphotransferase [Lachnospiraceae bacterium]
MQKTKTEINVDAFPKELRPYLAGADIYDSSSGSSAKVYYISSGYYLKVDARGTLEREASMAGWFYGAGLGTELVRYIKGNQDYMLTRAADGEDCLAALEHPKLLCEVLAKAMRRLHSMPVPNLPDSAVLENFYAALKRGTGDYYERALMPRFMVLKEEAWEIMQKNKHRLKRDTLIHGDFCLPNVMVKDGKFSCFIDLAMAGVGDKHIDLYWAVWSLQHNLKTEEYT